MDVAEEWLIDNAGPIVRWRAVRDLGLIVNESHNDLLDSVIATDEVQRWLGNLGGRQIHGSKDTCAENAMAKLVEYGLRAGNPESERICFRMSIDWRATRLSTAR